MARLGVMAERLRALDPDDPDRYGLSERAPSGAGWTPVCAPSTLIAAMRTGTGGHLALSPAVAAATMAGSLGYAAAGRLAVAIAVTGQAYDAGPDSLTVQLNGEGLVERIAVRN